KVPLLLQVSGLFGDLFLFRVVALLIFGHLPQLLFVAFPDLRLEGVLFRQVQFQDGLLVPSEMPPDVLGLVPGPLVRSLLLGQEHLLGGHGAPQVADGQEDRKNGGDQGDAAGEGLGLDLFQLFEFREFYLRHGIRSILGSFLKKNRFFALYEKYENVAPAPSPAAATAEGGASTFSFFVSPSGHCGSLRMTILDKMKF